MGGLVSLPLSPASHAAAVPGAPPLHPASLFRVLLPACHSVTGIPAKCPKRACWPVRAASLAVTAARETSTAKLNRRLQPLTSAPH